MVCAWARARAFPLRKEERNNTTHAPRLSFSNLMAGFGRSVTDSQDLNSDRCNTTWRGAVARLRGRSSPISRASGIRGKSTRECTQDKRPATAFQGTGQASATTTTKQQQQH